MYNSSSKHAVTVFSEKPKPFVVLIVFCQESVNEKVFNIIPINPDGTPLTHLQKQESDSENLALPFVESMIETWKFWSCHLLAATKNMKKYKHFLEISFFLVQVPGGL